MKVKFRAWNKIDKVMITDLNSPVVFHGVLQHDEDDILMQFTGLTDKNGKDIYAGDMIRCQNGFDWEVMFDDRGCFVACDPEDNINSVLLDDYEFKVIGNIHQHSHLLDKGE